MKIYVGWDPREDIAYQVCEHSIKRRDADAEVIPLKQNQMREQGIYTRELDKLATTEFTFTRFFVPYLSNYKGWAVFCDCDFLWKIHAKELRTILLTKACVLCTTRLHTKRRIYQDGRTSTNCLSQKELEQYGAMELCTS